ncbi:MAG: acyloxyacyl hydrolase [Devosia sp.]|nr:acyloxyacyl hydrolase [Devosia sp.]
MRIVAIAVLLAIGWCGAAEAAMFGEVRAGLLASVGGSDGALFDAARLENANLEFVFNPLIDASLMGSLHPLVGVTANFGGQESFGYAGLNWHVPVPLTPIFFEAGLGGALGSHLIGQSPTSPSGAQQFGCGLMWHAQASVGAAFFDVASVMLTAERYQPVSSCASETAFSTAGVRVGFGF